MLLRYVSVAQQLSHAFQSIPEVNYAGEQDRVHDLVTVYMTYLMDGRVIESTRTRGIPLKHCGTSSGANSAFHKRNSES